MQVERVAAHSAVDAAKLAAKKEMRHASDSLAEVDSKQRISIVARSRAATFVMQDSLAEVQEHEAEGSQPEPESFYAPDGQNRVSHRKS